MVLWSKSIKMFQNRPGTNQTSGSHCEQLIQVKGKNTRPISLKVRKWNSLPGFIRINLDISKILCSQLSDRRGQVIKDNAAGGTHKRWSQAPLMVDITSEIENSK